MNIEIAHTLKTTIWFIISAVNVLRQKFVNQKQKLLSYIDPVFTL